MRVTYVYALIAALGALAPPAACLSASVCDNIQAEWQSELPRLTGGFPYYTLLVSCTGNLSLEGYGVDSCVNAGKDCGRAAADAFCNYLGLDASAYDGEFTQIVPADAPTHSMTGEWCVSNGTYATLTNTSFVNISSYPGPFCSRLDSVLCYRSRNSSELIFEAEQARAASFGVPAAAPMASISAVVAGNIANSSASHPPAATPPPSHVPSISSVTGDNNLTTVTAQAG